MFFLFKFSKVRTVLARFILLAFLLQSCYNTNNFISDKDLSKNIAITAFKQEQVTQVNQVNNSKQAKKQPRYIHPGMNLLAGYQYTPQSGQIILFQAANNEKLRATVQEMMAGGFNRAYTLPVIIDPHFSFTQTALADPSWKKRHIHVTKSHIYVGKIGLLGGMIRD
ncbi:MAG: hypothetical protein ACK4M7_10330, partial [Burkholderiales bacterium]